MSSALELHDSTVLRVEVDGRELRLFLDAIVHVSDGEPGRDDGDVFSQQVLVTLEFDEEPQPGLVHATIFEGVFQIGAETFENLLQLPHASRSRARVTLATTSGKLEFTGVNLRVDANGRRRFLERFTRQKLDA